MTTNDDVLINKAAIIKRCLKRIHEEYNQDPSELRQNYTKQDSVLLNLQRACEAALDMANRYIRLHQAPIPQSSRDTFQILYQLNVLSEALNNNMQRMVGLRNIAVHDYQALNIDIVISVIEHHLTDFDEFIQKILSASDH